MKIEVRAQVKTDGVIERIIAALRLKPARVTAETADLLLHESQLRCPIRTGALRESGAKEKTGPMSYTVSYGNELVNYDEYVEYGTRYMRAQPYFTPAVEIARRYFAENMSRVFSPL